MRDVSATAEIFYCSSDAHWCRQCKSLESQFDEIATLLQGTNIRLAKVDGTAETALVERFQVSYTVNDCSNCL